MSDFAGNPLAFILSLPRSGSTLLSAMLSGHDAIHAPNEPWILLALASIYDCDPLRSGVARSRHDEIWALKAIRDFLTHDQFTQASRDFALSAYQSSLNAVGKSLFIDKTPRYFHILPWIDELFPHSRKIWLKRNPLDVAASYLTTWGNTLGELTGDPIVPRSYDLTIGLRRLADYANNFSGVLEVCYEDITLDPVPVLEQVCAHLKLTYQPGMVEYNKPSNLAERRQRALGDKNLYNHSKPHTSSIGRWENVFAAADIQWLIDFLGAEIFERMGYSTTLTRLKSMGVRFPSEYEVAERHAEILGKTLESPVSALDGAINIARAYYLEARERKFPPWFLTLEGWRIRSIKNKLVSGKKGLVRLYKKKSQ
jgi:protein-tyrosine sulfotransferase